jgi:hypothetical protein
MTAHNSPRVPVKVRRSCFTSHGTRPTPVAARNYDMWAQQRYSLRPGKTRGTEMAPAATIFVTIRGLRSAVNQFFVWDLQVAYPNTAINDSTLRVVLTPSCLSTDSLADVYMSSGMRCRLGEQSKPCLALLQRHVQWMVKFFGWLRAMEEFSLR